MNEPITALLALLLFGLLAGTASIWLLLRSKNMQHWIVPYLVTRKRNKLIRETAKAAGPIDVLFCFVDHFEPQWKKPSYDVELERVQRWTDGYPAMVSKHKDGDGVVPQHTFFYPEEEYRPEHIDALAELCRGGFGELEIHMHHDDDTAETLTAKLQSFIDIMHKKHSALPTDPKTGNAAWAFIHGNWALCNSEPNGNHCGVNEELTIFKELGCYVDMTMPSAPNASQARTVNRIYRASNMPGQPRSHDHGIEVNTEKRADGELLILPGPLGVSHHMRKLGIIPKIENGDVRSGLEGTPERIDQWVDTHIHVQGQPNWVFVKVHTHGTQEADEEALLGDAADQMYTHLEDRYNDGTKYRLHYVSAREMYNIVRAAEDGKSGNPNEFRDYELARASFIADKKLRAKCSEAPLD